MFDANASVAFHLPQHCTFLLLSVVFAPLGENDRQGIKVLLYATTRPPGVTPGGRASPRFASASPSPSGKLARASAQR